MSLPLARVTEIFEEKFASFVDTLRELHDSKRKAYTGGRHPLENYIKACSMLTAMGCREDRGCLPIMFARLSEKLNRMASLAGQEGFFEQKLFESFEDTCLDVAVIAGLCAAEYELLRLDDNAAKVVEAIKEEPFVEEGDTSFCPGCGCPNPTPSHVCKHDVARDRTEERCWCRECTGDPLAMPAPHNGDGVTYDVHLKTQLILFNMRRPLRGAGFGTTPHRSEISGY